MSIHISYKNSNRKLIKLLTFMNRLIIEYTYSTDRLHDMYNSFDCALKGIQTLTNYEQSSPTFATEREIKRICGLIIKHFSTTKKA